MRDARIAWLASQGYDRIGILGTSLDRACRCCTAAQRTAHQSRGRSIIFPPHFADVVWRACRHGTSARDSTATSIWICCGRLEADQPALVIWTPGAIATLLVYARYDLTFPVDLSEDLVRASASTACRTRVAVASRAAITPRQGTLQVLVWMDSDEIPEKRS